MSEPKISGFEVTVEVPELHKGLADHKMQCDFDCPFYREIHSQEDCILGWAEKRELEYLPGYMTDWLQPIPGGSCPRAEKAK